MISPTTIYETEGKNLLSTVTNRLRTKADLAQAGDEQARERVACKLASIHDWINSAAFNPVPVKGITTLSTSILPAFFNHL